MSTQSRATWVIILVATGVLIAYTRWPEFRRERALNAGGDTVQAAVEGVTTLTRSSGVRHWRYSRFFRVDYQFELGGTTLEGRYTCPCAQVAEMDGQEHIAVLVARANPAINRPLHVPVDSLTTDLVVLAAGLLMIPLAIWLALHDFSSSEKKPRRA